VETDALLDPGDPTFAWIFTLMGLEPAWLPAALELAA